MMNYKKVVTAFIMLCIVFAGALFIASGRTHERGIGRIELGSVTADDAWVAGKNYFCPGTGINGIIIRGMSFACEGYDGTTGNYSAPGDSTVGFTLYCYSWGADTCTLAVYISWLDTLTAATEYVAMTVDTDHDTLKLGDIMVFEYDETDTTSGVMALRYPVIMFEYDKY